MATLVGTMNKRLEERLPEWNMVSAREFFADENSSAMSIRDYVEENNLMRMALGLPLPEE